MNVSPEHERKATLESEHSNQYEDNLTGNGFALPDNGTEYERLWARDEVFAGILTALSVYLVISLSVYECRRSAVMREACNADNRRHKTFWKRVELFLTKGKLCLIASVSIMLRCLGEQIELRLGTSSDDACLIYQHLYVVNYQIPLLSLYLLLWARQRKMYRHRTLRHLTSSKLRFLSGTVIVGIFASSAVTVFVYFYSFRLVSSSVGCVYHFTDKHEPSSGTPGLMMFASACLFQFILMGLLVYPLVRHYHIALCCTKVAQQHINTQHVKRTVLRIAVCATVCVMSDFVVATTMAAMHDNHSPIMFWANVYSLNLIVNLIAVTCSFVDCHRRFFPCYEISYEVVMATQHTALPSTTV